MKKDDKVSEALLEKIKQKREEMNQIAQKQGINSEHTIKCSQELDKLLIKYQKLIH